MLDRSSLTDVLHLLAGICEGKAEHLRSNWRAAPNGRGLDLPVWEGSQS